MPVRLEAIRAVEHGMEITNITAQKLAASVTKTQELASRAQVLKELVAQFRLLQQELEEV